MGFARGLLGRHVGRRAEQLAVHGDGDFARFAAGEAEVHEVRLVVAIDDDVGRLEVAVDDAVFVGMIEGVGDSRTELGRLAVGGLLGGEPVVECRAANEIADDVNGVAVAADFVDADDVRMAELCSGAGFFEELFFFDGADADAAGNLSATTRSSWRSRAFQTVPKLPIPSCSTSSKRPIFERAGIAQVARRRSTRLKWLPHELQVTSSKESRRGRWWARWQSGQRTASTPWRVSSVARFTVLAGSSGTGNGSVSMMIEPTGSAR